MAANTADTLASIAAGKPVLCEKPLAETAAECEQILRAKEAAGKRLVQTGFMRRYDRGYVELRARVASGEIGCTAAGALRASQRKRAATMDV